MLCVPRSEAAFNRVLLPAAAQENLAQVLEYEIENLIPLPREEIYYDYSARDQGEERLEVLLMCIPRQVVQGYLDALERGHGAPARHRAGVDGDRRLRHVLSRRRHAGRSGCW